MTFCRSEFYNILFHYYVHSVVDQVTVSGFVTEEKAVEVEQFFKANPTPAAERIVKQKCEAIRLNAKWLERDSKAIEAWLKAQ